MFLIVFQLLIPSEGKKQNFNFVFVFFYQILFFFKPSTKENTFLKSTIYIGGVITHSYVATESNDWQQRLIMNEMSANQDFFLVYNLYAVCIYKLYVVSNSVVSMFCVLRMFWYLKEYWNSRERLSLHLIYTIDWYV